MRGACPFGAEWLELTFAVRHRRPMGKWMDQHELLASILCAAGGRHVEELLPPGYLGERADVVFRPANLIAEIKSFTSDRRRDPQVATKLGAVMERNIAIGAPVVFGTTKVRLHDLPKPVAEQALRVVGARIRKEVTKARRQIEATRQVLGMTDAYGLIVLVSPPQRLGNQTVAWLVNDALKHSGDMSGLDGAMVIETPLAFSASKFERHDTYSALWSISGRPFPADLADRFTEAWQQITSQTAQFADADDFIALGGSE